MKKILVGLAIGLGLLLVVSVALFQKSTAPFEQARAEAIEFAEERADLVQTDDFYWYNGTQTYFTVTGENSEGVPIVVIIQQDGGNMHVFNQEELISKEEAIQTTREAKQPKKILEARIGMEESLPVWEVSYRNENESIGYYVLSLETGEWIKSIENI